MSTILTDGKDVLFTGEVGDIIQADSTLQITITDILAPFCEKIDFDRQSLANRFFPLAHAHSVIIDPKQPFGQPVGWEHEYFHGNGRFWKPPKKSELL